MRTIKLIILLGLISFQAKIIEAQDLHTYELDPGHTFIQFTANRFGIVDVSGVFREVSGTIIYNPEKPGETSASIVIKTASVESGLEARQNAIMSRAFLDVATYPEMTFESRNVEVKDDKLLVTGDLTLHGTTNRISFLFSIKGPYKDPTKAITIGIKGSLTINRQDYGMNFNKLLENGLPFVGNDILIQLNVLAYKR